MSKSVKNFGRHFALLQIEQKYDLKILKYNDQSLLYGNQLTHKWYAQTHVYFCKS